MVARHGLVMASPHHDAHIVSGLRVQRVVSIEGPPPHGWPQEVPLQAQDELKNSLVETVVAIVRTVGVHHPRRQTWCLVVQEQATVAHPGFAVSILAKLDKYSVMLRHRHVSPPVPRRHTYLLRQLIDAEHGATLVAAGNHQLLPDGLDDVLLRPSLQVCQHALLHPLVYLAVTTHGTYHDG